MIKKIIKKILRIPINSNEYNNKGVEESERKDISLQFHTLIRLSSSILGTNMHGSIKALF